MTSKSNATEWDLNLAVFRETEGIVALVEALRRYGAHEVNFGFVEEDVDELWPENPVHAFARVTWLGGPFGKFDDYEEVKIERGTDVPQLDMGLNEALARIVRSKGGNVVIMLGDKK